MTPATARCKSTVPSGQDSEHLQAVRRFRLGVAVENPGPPSPLSQKHDALPRRNLAEQVTGQLAVLVID